MVEQGVKLVGNSHVSRVIKDINELGYMCPNSGVLDLHRRDPLEQKILCDVRYRHATRLKQTHRFA